MSKQTALIILDGWGHREESEHNAIAQAKTPYFEYLWNNYPHTLLYAGEQYVGLPKGQFGNSEIGHMTIGAGTIIDTDLVRIAKAINDESFHHNEALVNLCDYINSNKSALHVMGLIGVGGVHAHSDHLYAFLKLAKDKGIEKCYIHVFTDGRDTGPYDAVHALEELQSICDELQFGTIASVSGRFWSMDRDNNWDRLEKFHNEVFECKNGLCQLALLEELKRQHSEGRTDEHIEPFALVEAPLNQNDGVFIFNFRADRARMITQKICELKKTLNLHIVTLTEYQKDFDVTVAFPSQNIKTTLAQEVSNAGFKQAHIAETEKFPHATYFLNGGKEDPHEGEEHVLLPSRKDVQTHDEAPEMRAEAIADEAIARINAGVEFIFINFANPDMVGHTANMTAIIHAIEFVDIQLKRVCDALIARGGVAIVTADHGNAEVNINSETGEKHTAHTLNQVPCIITDSSISIMKKSDVSLQDLAPTVLKMLEIEKPEVMTGESLF
jgi:2,3-bisphosphoglycerate-independent phosphoglycerate mutase